MLHEPKASDLAALTMPKLSATPEAPPEIEPETVPAPPEIEPSPAPHKPPIRLPDDPDPSWEPGPQG